MKKTFTLLLLLCLTAISAMAQETNTFIPRYAGGDISLLPSYEANGTRYCDLNGKVIPDIIPFCKDAGLNTMRVRLFVDPSKAPADEIAEGVRQDLDYVKALGKRIKDAGMKLMLDFHYSDTWADPVNQWTPDAWKDLSDTELYDKIYEYTKEVLQEMKAAGAEPDFIQTGNEISYGLCWGPYGTKSPVKASDNWKRFATLLNRASKACREECPDAKVIVHTEFVRNPGMITYFYDNITKWNVDYDIIGTSFYSYYHGDLDALDNALTIMEGYGKEIMVVEMAYYHAYQCAISGSGKDLSGIYPISQEGQALYLKALIDVLLKHDTVTGLFWWWMEANEYGHTGPQQTTKDWYNASLWDDQTGKVSPALFVMKDFIGEQPTAINTVTAETKATPSARYNLNGQRVGNNYKGIVIENGKKTIRK